MTIRVLLLDDHAVVRDGLQALIGAQPDIEVVGSFGSADEAIRFAAETPPDVAVLDGRLPDVDTPADLASLPGGAGDGGRLPAFVVSPK